MDHITTCKPVTVADIDEIFAAPVDAARRAGGTLEDEPAIYTVGSHLNGLTNGALLEKVWNKRKQTGLEANLADRLAHAMDILVAMLKGRCSHC